VGDNFFQFGLRKTVRGVTIPVALAVLLCEVDLIGMRSNDIGLDQPPQPSGITALQEPILSLNARSYAAGG
jgi:hypothetical protein